MLLYQCINLWFARIFNALCISGLSVSDRVELEKVRTRAAWLIKGVDAICARNNEANQDSSAWGRGGTEQE